MKYFLVVSNCKMYDKVVICWKNAFYALFLLLLISDVLLSSKCLYKNITSRINDAARDMLFCKCMFVRMT